MRTNRKAFTRVQLPPPKSRKTFFMCLSHVGTSCTRSDFLFHKKSVIRSTIPPFPQKVTLRLRCSLVNALTTLRLAVGFLRVATTAPYWHLFCSVNPFIERRRTKLGSTPFGWLYKLHLQIICEHLKIVTYFCATFACFQPISKSWIRLLHKR